jgi:hypothetical protein
MVGNCALTPFCRSVEPKAAHMSQNEVNYGINLSVGMTSATYSPRKVDVILLQIHFAEHFSLRSNDSNGCRV